MALRKSGRAPAALPLLLTAACLGSYCNGEPTPPSAGYLAAAPNALDVYVADPSKPQSVDLVAIVYDRYGRVLEGMPVSFAPTPGLPRLSIAKLNATGDTVRLTVAAATAPSDMQAKIVVRHQREGEPDLSVTIPLTVRYAPAGAHGVAADADTPTWPMVGLATGRAGGEWERHVMQPFVRRTGFATFDDAGLPQPPGEFPAGVVLSSKYALWREESPWSSAPRDVKVPSSVAAERRKITVAAYFAGESFAGSKEQFLWDLQAAADILEHTLAGVTVAINGPADLGTAIGWDECRVLGETLAALLPSDRPTTTTLAVYMLKRAGVVGGDRGLHCGPDALASAALGDVHAIFLPEGPVPIATIAHEFGHALSLQHVSFGSGYFDDNLMVETDEASARLRDRLTVGQAFRAAVDRGSWLAKAVLDADQEVGCDESPHACPPLDLDILVRTP
jgi:hypothetical protein